MKETMKMVTDQFGVGKDLVFEQEPEIPTQENGVSEPEQPEVAQAAPELEQEVAAPIEEPKPIKETRNASNFRALKAEAARIAQERDEMRQRLEQLERQQRYEQKPTQQSAPVSDDIDIDPDAYAEGKHIKNISRQMKSMQQELERSRAETQRMAIKAALVSEHPDFDRVVNPDNLKALELTYPHLARAINVNDQYAAGKACYDLIKQFGLDQNEIDATEVTKAMISQNLAKPKPGAAVKGTRPTNESTMGRASEFYQGELTDQMKKQFHKELQDAMKGYGGYKP